jgi:hypothetical protein
MRFALHVTRVRRVEVCTGFWWGRLNEGDHLEDVVVDGKVILMY